MVDRRRRLSLHQDLHYLPGQAEGEDRHFRDHYPLQHWERCNLPLDTAPCNMGRRRKLGLLANAMDGESGHWSSENGQDSAELKKAGMADPTQALRALLDNAVTSGI